MINIDEGMRRHQRRMRKIYTDVGCAVVVIMCYLAGIYVTVHNGSNLKNFLPESLNVVLIVSIAGVYIAGHVIAILGCILRIMISRRTLRREVLASGPL